MLVGHPNHLEITRFAVVASRAVGNAVQRNRSKRIIRAVLQNLQPTIKQGWDFILIARRPLPEATYWQVFAAIGKLLERAQVINSKTRDELPFTK